MPVLSLGRRVDPADSSESPGESGPVRESSRISRGGESWILDQDIVQRSASEQTHESLYLVQ